MVIAGSFILPLGKNFSIAPVFIVGTGRCGTTLVRLILNQHRNLAIIDEASLLAKRRRYGPLTNPLSLDRFCKDWTIALRASSPYAETMRSYQLRSKLAKAANYTEAIDITATHYAELEGKSRWGNKSPEDVQRLKTVIGAFPNAKIVHLTRDPRAVVCSLLLAENRAFSSVNLYLVARYWAKCERLAAKFEKFAPQNIKRVRYEELVEKPEATVRDICRFIGVDFDDRMLEYSLSASKYAPKTRDGQLAVAHKELLNPVNTAPMAKWKRALSPPMIAHIERAAGGWFTRLGYQTASDDMPRVGALTHGALELVWQFDKLKLFVQRLTLSTFWTLRALVEMVQWPGRKVPSGEQHPRR